MAAKDDSLYLGHMLDYAREAQGLIKGVTRQQFDQDKKLRWALVHLFQIVVGPELAVRSGGSQFVEIELRSAKEVILLFFMLD